VFRPLKIVRQCKIRNPLYPNGTYTYRRLQQAEGLYFARRAYLCVLSGTQNKQWLFDFTLLVFKRFSQNCEKRLFVSSCLSVPPSVHLSPWNNPVPTPEGFSWNLMFLSKNSRENSSSIQILQGERILYMKTNIHFWSYLAHFFLEWEIFQTNL
jgi:hypothetical protein